MIKFYHWDVQSHKNDKPTIVELGFGFIVLQNNMTMHADRQGVWSHPLSFQLQSKRCYQIESCIQSLTNDQPLAAPTIAPLMAQRDDGREYECSVPPLSENVVAIELVEFSNTC